MAQFYSTVKPVSYVEYDDFYEGVMWDGGSFYISKEDYEFVSQNYWHYMDGYVKSTRHGLMHRHFMKEQLVEKLQVDHINNNRLDNRRSNLRVVTQQENLNKKTTYKSNTSGHPGIKWNKRLNKWQAQITRNKQRAHLGVFESFQEAVIARKIAERA